MDNGGNLGMANKRMFTMKIVDSDAFLDMPLSAQCLYFHLNMRADDDGFIGNPKRIMRTVGGHEDDLKLLIAKRFLLTFEDGVIVIKHWRMHNCISQNRYHETQYTDQKRQLLIKDNKSYSTTHGMPINDKKVLDSQGAVIPVIERESPEIEIEATQKKQKRNNYPDEFEKFWKEYPKKKDKGLAYSQYRARINSGYSPDELCEASKNYRLECEREHKNEKFIKHAKTFLGPATPFLDYINQEEEQHEHTTEGNGNVDFDKYL
jgi:hypothetical protein